jgi:glycosyltransferase involved in cell wall biosynthesis
VLNVLAIYPAFDPAINEMAMAWQRLCQQDKILCTVVAGAVDRLKGQASTMFVENTHNLEIHRVPAAPTSSVGLALATKIARKIKPDVIFCAVAQNMPAAIEAQKAAYAPIVLHTEYFLDDTMGLRRGAYLGLEWLRPRLHRQYRERLQSQSERILCSNPVEFVGEFPESLAEKFKYLPWPHPPIVDEPGKDNHQSHFAAYIGSVGRAKGSGVLQRYFSALLDAMPDFRLCIVGPAIDKAGAAAIEALRTTGGSRVEIRSQCPRAEALELIRRSQFVLSPANRLGWGLLGDAWSTGTPVIAVGSHYDVRAGENCLIAEDSAAFLDQVIRLQRDDHLRKTLVNGGYDTASRHSMEAVTNALMQGIEIAFPRNLSNH